MDKDLKYSQVVLSLGSNISHGTSGLGWQHDIVHVDEGVLVHLSINVTPSDVVADFEIQRLKVPHDLFVQCRSIDTTGNVNALGDVLNVLRSIVACEPHGF